MMFIIRVRYPFGYSVGRCLCFKKNRSQDKGLEKVGGLRFMIGEKLNEEKQRNNSKP